MQETGSEEYKFATLTERQYEVIDAMAEDPEEWVRQVLAAVERWSQEKVGHQVHLEAFHIGELCAKSGIWLNDKPIDIKGYKHFNA